MSCVMLLWSMEEHGPVQAFIINQLICFRYGKSVAISGISVFCAH